MEITSNMNWRALLKEYIEWGTLHRQNGQKEAKTQSGAWFTMVNGNLYKLEEKGLPYDTV